MLFYCPNCREEKEAVETSTITTKSGRIAHKANCPVCNQDLTEFIPHEKAPVVQDKAPETETN